MKPYRIRDIRQPLSLGARTLARGLWRGAAVTGVIAALLGQPCRHSIYRASPDTPRIEMPIQCP
jgi:hypothetical protein